MPWLEIRFQSASAEIEETEHLLNQLGACSVSIHDAGDQPVLEPAPGEFPLWQDLQIRALFEANAEAKHVTATIARELNVDEKLIEHKNIADQHWETLWMDDFKPIQFGQRLWICPSWTEPPDPNATNLMLDPGMAFGSGTHPTTFMCMQYLDENPPADQQVLDYGCGSGILALAAALLGARHVTGVDIDPQAILAATQNAKKNALAEDIFDFYPANELSALKCDLLLANILSETLIQLSNELKSLVTVGGNIVLSGVLEYQTEAVVAAYSDCFDVTEIKHQDEWVMISAKKQRD